jgi:ectoine hydroxylase-related dioxygenase (phytanoyl-CoA dioxygenase family)
MKPSRAVAAAVTAAGGSAVVGAAGAGGVGGGHGVAPADAEGSERKVRGSRDGAATASTATYVWPVGLPRPVRGVPMVGGYVQSFGVDDAKAIQVFYKRFGFAVIHEAWSLADCVKTIDEIWSLIEARGPVRRGLPATWSNGNWDSLGSIATSEGMLGEGAIFAPMAVRNRCNPTMLRVAQLLLNRRDLLVSHDRYGIFRPTQPHHQPTSASDDASKSNETRFDNNKGGVSDSNYATMANLHLDMNPWREPGDELTQAMLAQLTYSRPEHFLDENNLPMQLPAIQMLANLKDNQEHDGGLQLIPGFPDRHYEEWVESRRGSLLLSGAHTIEDNFIRLDDDDPLHDHAVRVTARAGSLIIWDKRMVHGSQPNRSDQFRYAQFFLMFAAQPMTVKRAAARRAAILAGLERAMIDPNSLPLTAKSLFGLLSPATTQTPSPTEKQSPSAQPTTPAESAIVAAQSASKQQIHSNRK